MMTKHYQTKSFPMVVSHATRRQRIDSIASTLMPPLVVEARTSEHRRITISTHWKNVGVVVNVVNVVILYSHDFLFSWSNRGSRVELLVNWTYFKYNEYTWVYRDCSVSISLTYHFIDNEYFQDAFHMPFKIQCNAPPIVWSKKKNYFSLPWGIIPGSEVGQVALVFGLATLVGQPVTQKICSVDE